MIAHELRTPLAALKISAASIHRSLPQLLEGYELGLATGKVQNPIRKDHLEGLKKTLFDIDHCINYAQSTINMILVGFHHTSATESVPVEPFSLSKSVQKAIDLYPFRPDQLGCVTVRLSDDLIVIGQEQILIYSLHNLFKNSLQAIDASGKGAISIEAKRGSGQIELIFTDTAQGIEATVLPHIFEAFYTTKEKASESIGLGLYFCKMALRRMGADICCESELNQYTKFSLSLLASDQK